MWGPAMKYAIYHLNNGRAIEVHADMLMRFAFYEVIGENRERIKFRRKDNKCLGYATGEIIIFRKPTSNAFHKEYIKNNCRLLSGWGGISHDNLVENMLEEIERI